MERYADSAKVYYEAVELDDGGISRATLLTNLTAALLKAQQYDGVIEIAAKYDDIIKRTYDLAFNVACTFIEKGDYDKASTYLKIARGLLFIVQSSSLILSRCSRCVCRLYYLRRSKSRGCRHQDPTSLSVTTSRPERGGHGSLSRSWSLQVRKVELI